jgi:hypothetical protein
MQLYGIIYTLISSKNLVKKNKNGGFSSLLSHSTIIIFNAIIWYNIYFDFIEEGERRKVKAEKYIERRKKK